MHFLVESDSAKMPKFVVGFFFYVRERAFLPIYIYIGQRAYPLESSKTTA